MSDYLTAREVAEELRVTPVSVQTWCRTGQLKAVQAGRQWRIKREDLETFLKRKEAQSQDDPKVNGLTGGSARPFLVAL